jgi:hypothetical protein
LNARRLTVASVLEAAHYHTVATERRCASQENCALMSQMGQKTPNAIQAGGRSISADRNVPAFDTAGFV